MKAAACGSSGPKAAQGFDGQKVTAKLLNDEEFLGKKDWELGNCNHYISASKPSVEISAVIDPIYRATYSQSLWRWKIKMNDKTGPSSYNYLAGPDDPMPSKDVVQEKWNDVLAKNQ